MQSVLRKLSVTFAAALLAGAAGAATVAPLSEKAMTRQADTIVVGRVLGTQSEWVGKTLVTVATVEVDETLKGAKADTVEVVLPGGIDASRRVPIAMTYPGAPKLLPDEEVVLFLDRTSLDGATSGASARSSRANAGGALIVSGYSQGKYSVAREPGGATIVTRNASEAGDIGVPGLREGGTERRTLDEFRRQLQGYLARPR